jgi:hypothetical protein
MARVRQRAGKRGEGRAAAGGSPEFSGGGSRGASWTGMVQRPPTSFRFYTLVIFFNRADR